MDAGGGGRRWSMEVADGGEDVSGEWSIRMYMEDGGEDGVGGWKRVGGCIEGVD
jgi:hypothetical protein